MQAAKCKPDMGTSLLNALYATDTGGGDTNKTVSFKVYSITCVDKISPHKNETITKWTLDLEKLKKKLLAFFFHLVARSFSSSLILTNPPFFLAPRILLFCVYLRPHSSLSLFLEKPEGLSWLKTVEGWLISSLHKFLPAAREFSFSLLVLWILLLILFSIFFFFL